MRKGSWLIIVISLILSIAFISCGGYVKKDELEKQLSDQKTDIDQRVQLAQDSATTANDKADKALNLGKDMEKMKTDILTTVDGKIDSALVASRGDSGEELKRIASEAANKALADANANAMAEDEKVKLAAKEGADKAMNAAMEADRRAQEAAKQAELAKELPKPVRGDTSSTFAVYFDAGKTKLKEDGIAELEKAANMIKSNPNATIKIEGHADNTPVVYSKYGSNWVLSQARSQVVLDYLVDKLGVSAASIKIALGYGEFKPAAPNDKKNKWQNRRVEVIVTP